MIKTTDMLLEELNEYAAPRSKLFHMVKYGEIFPVVKGLYIGQDIGFLGAGMIILKANNVITGLTTAAGVWTTATIGIAVGYGYYIGALIVTAFFLATIILFAKFERQRKSTEIIYIELDNLYKVNATLVELEK